MYSTMTWNGAGGGERRGHCLPQNGLSYSHAGR